MVYVNLAFGLTTLLTWFGAQFMDPGFVKRPKQVDFLSLM